MDMRTKILRTNISRTNISPSHADRAAIFRLSWHGFLVCAFAVMTFLAWATLRQALGSELNANGSATDWRNESRALPCADGSHNTKRCGNR
jgi:hypothetical protein